MLSTRTNKLNWIYGLLLLVVAIVLVFGIPYSSGYGTNKRSLFIRAYQYYSNPDWTHCMMAPFVTGFLVWFLRKNWKGLALNGSWLGLPLLLFGFLLYWYGYRANIRYVGFASVQFLVGGSVLWFMGWKWFKALLLPILFLCFSWPLQPLTDSGPSFALRKLMTSAANIFLNGVGVETIQAGTSLSSAPNPEKNLAIGEVFQIGVDDPCSGLRSFFALLMIGTIMSFIMLKNPIKQLSVIAMAIPVALFGNFVRLITIVFGTILWGADFAVGVDGGTSYYHFFAGIFSFLIGSLILYVITLYLSKGMKAFKRNQVVRRSQYSNAS